MSKILVVDDEQSISKIIKFNLIKEGFEVVTAVDGQEALDFFEDQEIDLVLLDQMLPEIEGIEVLRRIRIISAVPVIMVTAKNSEIDKVLGLEMGADDYVTKPFSNRELIARVKANLRVNTPENTDLIITEEDIVINNFVIKPNIFTILKDNVEIDLSRREFDLLYLLIKNEGQMVTRQTILDKIWGIDNKGDLRTVDVTVHRIRHKIEENPSRPKILTTKRGVGYTFMEEVPDI